MFARSIRRSAPPLAALLFALLMAACGGGKTPTTPTTPQPTLSVTTNVNPMVQGGTYQIYATLVSADGHVFRDCHSSAAWQSTNTSVATVSAIGLLTAVGVGEANVSATCEGLTGSLQITVKPMNRGLTVAGLSPIAPGQSTQYTATSLVSSLLTMDRCTTATWQSSDTDIARVSATGLVTGVGTGETDISATCNGLTGTAHVLVSAVASLTLTSPSQLTVGQTSQFRGTALLRDLTTFDCSASATWESSSPTVASVSQTGLVSALASGGTTIKVTCQGTAASAFLSVAPATQPTYASVAITGPNPLPPGEAAQFTATLTRADGTKADCTSTATWRAWSMTPATTVTVTPTGLVTASSQSLPAVVELYATCESGSGHLDVTMTTGSLYAISGTVRDENGAPLEGVTVQAEPRSTSRYSVATTDASGKYRIGDLVPGTVDLSAAKSNYDTALASFQLSADATRDFTLSRTRSVYGAIYDDTIAVPSERRRLTGATVAIVAGVNAGRSLTSDAAAWYVFAKLTPGSFTIRASMPGYNSAEHAVFLSADSPGFQVDFSLTRSRTCPDSVSPLVFKYFPSAGGSAQVAVTAAAGQPWMATTSDSWISVVSGASGTGSGTVTFEAAPNSQWYRDGRITIACPGATGQTVTISQYSSTCSITLSGSPTEFDKYGGQGTVNVQSYNCPWQAVTKVPWITVLSATTSSYGNSGTVTFRVDFNTDGADRTGTIVIGEKTWEVKQKG